MKRKILFLCLVVFMFMAGVNAKSTYETSGNSCLASNTCIVLCNYTNTVKSSGSENRYITIYYHLHSEKFSVGWWDDKSSTTMGVVKNTSKNVGPYSYEDLFEKNKILIQKKSSAKNFTCPTNGYFDIKNGKKVCFDENASWCASKSGKLTSLGGSIFADGSNNKNFISEKRDMTFEDDVTEYFNTWRIDKDRVSKDFKLDKYSSGKDFLKDTVIGDFKRDYLHLNDTPLVENKIPVFIENSSAFKNGLNHIYNEFGDYFNVLVYEYNKNPDMTRDEYNELVDELAAKANAKSDALEKGSNSSNNQVVDSNLEIVTELDICDPDSGSLLVFQVVGYIILIVKILVPILLVVLGSIDLAKASLSGDDKVLYDSVVKFAKRILLGIIIFFIPTILDFFLSLVAGVSDTMEKYENCTKCIFNPGDDSKCSPKKLNG